MYQRGDLKEGMTVRSVDGHKLGKVYAVGDTEFHIEKGLFFPKDYSVRYAEISDIRHGEIILAHGKESLRAFSDEVPYGSDAIAQREGIGTSPVTRAQASDAAWMNAGERTGVPLGSDLRTQDLGNQEIGPYNTEGARASPILTEEDRARGVGIPIHREVVDRPVMRASTEDSVVGTPLRAEEESARARTMRDEDLPVVHDELYDEPHHLEHLGSHGRASEEGTRKLDLSGETDPKNKRGF
ncbi:hypothetical protein F0U60_47725 [Archangium minus]|uniref:DUF2171 domain-containing protein n=1 Tax=Archangium minus TaxID=83450 RepID=A0ABY9X6E6_9BACT|nr:hypothetical protein F0U60_47725 [Archangium minus]